MVERAESDTRDKPAMELDNSASKPNPMLYALDSVPPWYLTATFAFQHYITMLSGTLTAPLILAPALCLQRDSVAFGELINTFFFVGGIATLLQTVFGSRLPVIQGASFAFMTPAFAILSLPQWQCPTDMGSQDNSTTPAFFNGTVSGANDTDDIWKSRMREIQGSIIVASFVEVGVGAFGGMGLLLRYVGPLTIAPTISLVGFSLTPVAASFCAKHWWIATMMIMLILIFSQYLRNVRVPLVSCSVSKGIRVKSYPVFHIYAVVLAIAMGWGVCALLTTYDVLPDDPTAWGYDARTDVKMNRLTQSSWFRFPYPFQWGMPTFSTAGACAMMAAVFAAMIELVGSLYAVAEMAAVPPPPVHAINRGVLAQGVGCVLAGLWGTGCGTAVYSENIAIIGMTNIASRRVNEIAGVILIIFGMVGKIGGFFATIPDPVMGGVFMVMFGIITAVGILNLQMVDLRIPRNLFIAGFSLFIGLSLPQWLENNSGSIDTGVYTLDQILIVFGGTGMLVGGITAFVLDNTIPGTEEERGLKPWRENLKLSMKTNPNKASSYDLPFGMAAIRRSTWAHRVPVSPTFNKGSTKQTETIEESQHSDDSGIDQPVSHIERTTDNHAVFAGSGVNNMAYNDSNGCAS